MEIRAGYHEWQRMDSFICKSCGIHWQEDFDDYAQVSQFKERGFVWVMCDAQHPLLPILNPDSLDQEQDRSRFVRNGLRKLKAYLVKKVK
jgi:hypothetical protein